MFFHEIHPKESEPKKTETALALKGEYDMIKAGYLSIAIKFKR
jgi:hypothetical protein